MPRPILPQPPAFNPDRRPNASLLQMPTPQLGAPSKQQDRALPPIPDLRIDNLGKGPDAWLKAIHQWNVAASSGMEPLKSWKPECYQGDMAPYFALKRSQRKTIAEEYTR